MEHASRDITPAPLTLARSSVTAAFDYMPRDLPELLEFAATMAKSTMIPKQYIDQPGNIVVAVQWGAEVGLKPLQAMQSIAVINGKPGLYGDAGKALLMSHGCQIIEQDTREIEAQGYASCTIKRPGRPDVTRTFGLEDAKRAKLMNKEGPWTNYPFRQMAWRAFWFAARDAAPDILRGMGGKEELEDMKDVTADSTVERAAPAAAASTTKTSVLKERLRIVNFNDVIKAFTEATDAPSLAAAVDKAKGLKDPGQQEQANNAYHAAKERIRKAATPDPAAITDDAIVTKLAAAKTADEVNLIADLLRPLQEADEPRYEALYQRCVDRVAELEPK